MKVKEILFKKEIYYPYEEEAARSFHKFLIEHPEYNENDLHMYVNKELEECDPRGNCGGGYEYTFIIYVWREETQEEKDKRINAIEQDIIDMYVEKFKKLLNELKQTCDNISVLELESKIKIYNKISENIGINIEYKK